MKISDADIRAVARLAQLDLDARSVERMRTDLDAILSYVEKLEELDTTGVPPTAHVLERPTPLRADEVADVLDAEAVVERAPAHDDTAIVVPKVIE